MLTCNTSTRLQLWTVVDPNTEMSHTRHVSVPTAPGTIMPLQVQSFMVNFAVISAIGTLPLISTLTVDDVTDYLNTSRISCQELETGIIEMVTVHIVSDPSSSLEGACIKICMLQLTVSLSLCTGVSVEYYLMDPSFGIGNVSVLLLLNKTSQEVEMSAAVNFSITTSSSQVKIKYQERVRYLLVVPYNTQINVSIVARLCGQQSRSTNIPLNYSK